MKITKTFPRIGLSVVLSLTFFLLPITSINVSATSNSNEGDFWHGFYVEHITKEISGTGVDIGNAESTDYGLTTGNYIYNKCGVSTQDVIDYVSEQYSNAAGYITESASDYDDKVRNVLNRTIDGTLSAGYKAEKALRTVVDSAGNVYYNVSSTDYWNGIYNRWFNNSGYKVQYDEVNNGVSVNFDNGSVVIININYGDRSYNWVRNGNTNQIVSNILYNPETFCLDYKTTTNINNIIPLFSITVKTNDGNATVYYPWTNFHNECVTCYNNGGLKLNDVSYSNGNIYFRWGYNNTFPYQGSIKIKNSVYQDTSQNTEYIPKPAQVGFIQYPLGSKTPIYTDPSLKPSDWIINDNGTVTIDGNDYPALIDEKEIDDNGWLDMLNLLDGEDSREMSLKDPWGKPWDTQDDGSVLGGFFGNLVKDIQKMFKGIGDTIKKIFEKPIDVLSDLVEKIKKALSDFFTIDYDSLDDVELDVNYNIIMTIWNKLLELLGVTSGGS